MQLSRWYFWPVLVTCTYSVSLTVSDAAGTDAAGTAFGAEYTPNVKLKIAVSTIAIIKGSLLLLGGFKTV